MRSWLFPLALVGLMSRDSKAEPSPWERARKPDMALAHDLSTQAEGILARQGSRNSQVDREEVLERAWNLLRRAKELHSSAKTSLLLANVYLEISDLEAARVELESIAPNELGPSLGADRDATLGLVYARLARYEDEVRAYDRALLHQAHPLTRTRLLANRGEARMALGDSASATIDYAAALQNLSTVEMFRHGVTALWGLAVALDRSGDLDAALARIRVARSYDALDQQIHSANWLFIPAHDEAWYAALGHWATARSVGDEALRRSHYERSLEAWARYLRKAKENDPYLPIARLRMAECRQEHQRQPKAKH